MTTNKQQDIKIMNLNCNNCGSSLLEVIGLVENGTGNLLLRCKSCGQLCWIPVNLRVEEVEIKQAKSKSTGSYLG